jgi:hypothetical protein
VSNIAYGENLFEWSVSANTCGLDSLKAMITVTRAAKPATPAITQLDGDSLFCTVAAFTYEWQLDGKPTGFTTRTIKVQQKGNYTVAVTSQQGCSSDSSAPFTYVTTGLAPQLADMVKVYPNPTSGKIMVVLPASLGNQVQITLTDAMGRNVYEQKINYSVDSEFSEEIDISSATAGLYFIKLHTEKGTIVKKIFKK